MRILCNDIGTGTQDIFLFDSRLDVENGYKLILPSPTMMIHRTLKHAAEKKQSVALSGVMMGGGPSSWGVEAVLKSGARVFATPDAAKTINDDLDQVREMGVTLLSTDELRSLNSDVLRIELRDFDFDAIRDTFSRFGISLDDLDAVAVAVFDHGAAPPEISDRKFRFDYLDERIRLRNSLSTFAFKRNQIPPSMTRLQAVEISARNTPGELILMDTAAAAIAGALLDRKVSSLSNVVIANVGNFHTLAFRMNQGKIEGVFEHHTGLLTTEKLDGYLEKLMDGSLDREIGFRRSWSWLADLQSGSNAKGERGLRPGSHRSKAGIHAGFTVSQLLSSPLWRYDDQRLFRSAHCGCRPHPGKACGDHGFTAEFQRRRNHSLGYP